MATSLPPTDFKDFLRLLNSKQVEYLLVGGYAVGYHGYPRATADMDVWIAIHPRNAGKMVEVVREFGFSVEGLSEELFLKENNVVRMGVPPLRIEVLTTISGVSFEECYRERVTDAFDDVKVHFISLKHLKANPGHPISCGPTGQSTIGDVVRGWPFSTSPRRRNSSSFAILEFLAFFAPWRLIQV